MMTAHAQAIQSGANTVSSAASVVDFKVGANALQKSSFTGRLSSQELDLAVQYVMQDKNKFNHIFRHPNHDHKLDPLIALLGGHEQVVRTVLQAAQDKLPAVGKMSDISVNVAGYTVWIRGYVHNGIPKIGTLFIK
jgi:hypothetical protein